LSAPAAIRTLLAEVRRRLRRQGAAQAALYLAAAALFLAVAAPLSAVATGAGRGVGGLTLVLGGGALLAGLVGGLLIPARRWRSDRRVAAHVGRQVPPLASDLLSSVELDGARDASRRGTFSGELVDALVESTAQKLDGVDRATLVPRQPLWRPARAALAAAVLAGACALLMPGRVTRGWRAMLASETGGRFAGAAESPVPLVGDLDITLHYPAYTGREPARLESASGDVRVVPGTRVEIATRPLEETRAAWIAFDAEGGNPPHADLPLSVEGEHLRGSFEVRTPLRYRFLLEGSGGQRRVESEPRPIDIEPDREPRVELHAPAEELDVTGMKRIELAFVADDDYGLTRAELVWTGTDRPRRMPLELPREGGQAAPKTAQNKIFWDLADVGMEPGARVAYHVEVFDNDAIGGSKPGLSRTFYLRVLSPRERHERNIEAQRELFEHMVRGLGGRLTVPPADLAAHEALQREASSLVVELGTVAASLEKDELAEKQLMGVLSEMRGRLDKLVSKEAKLLRRIGPNGKPGTQLQPSDRAQTIELEDDTILLADWLDRQEMQDLLSITDEIKGHQDRLKKLFEEYKRTGSAEIKAEIERELRALEQRMAELSARKDKMAADVLDQFVNNEAVEAKQAVDCLGEVKKLLAAGDAEAAERKMRECAAELDQSAEALEKALDELRGDKFSAEQKKFEELRSELADLADDQKAVADEADRVQKNYAEASEDLMKEKAAEKRAELSELLQKLEKRVGQVPDEGVGQFVEEELSAVKKRLGDIEHMLSEGDLAEALSMAREAEAGLETVESELEGSIEDDDKRFRKASERALDPTRKALPLARKLVEELEQATPSPSKVLGQEDLAKLDKLARKQQALRDRAEKLGEKARAMGKELPGESGQRMSERLGEAGGKMKGAAQRMRMVDPSGARQEAREAAEKLSEAEGEARGAARQQQSQGGRGLREEPVRIPGADEYRAPEKFREDILDAMKKDQAPTPYRDMVKRYYEELIR
jgi:hypothetical protein